MYRIFGELVQVEVVFAILGLLSFCLLALRLRTLLLLTIIALFLPSLNIPYISGLGRLLRWAFLGGLVAKGLFANLQSGFTPRPHTREHKVLIALAALVLASSFWSIGAEVSAAQGAMMCVLWAGIFLVMWNSWRDRGEILALCNILYVLATLIFLLEGVYMAFGLGRGGAHGRYAGAFWNPNGLGTAVAFLGPFVYWKHRTATRGIHRQLPKLLGAIMAVSLLMSGSRSGFLGAIVCMGVMLTYVHRTRIAVTLAIVAPPLILLVILAPRLESSALAESGFATRMVRVESLSNLSDRVELWETGYANFLHKPILGHGFGMIRFADLGRANMELARAAVKFGDIDLHSTYLQLAIDVGVVGVALFLVFLGSVLLRGFQIFRDPSHGELETAGIAFYAALLALVGDSFVHGWVFAPGSSSAIVFWLVAAAVMRVHTILSAEAEQAAESEEAADVANLVPAGT